MLSKPWVWVVRIIWMLLIAGVLWREYLNRDFYLTGFGTWVGAAGNISGAIAVYSLFLILVPKMFIPEIFPDRFFQVERTSKTLCVGQCIFLIFIILMLLGFYLITASIDENSSDARRLSFCVLGALLFVASCSLLVQAWPYRTVFSVDSEGVKHLGANGSYRVIFYGEISKIIVAEQKLYNYVSLVLIGRVSERTTEFLVPRRFKVVEKDRLQIPKQLHRGFSNEEVLQRILAHCDDSVQVEYVKRIGR